MKDDPPNHNNPPSRTVVCGDDAQVCIQAESNKDNTDLNVQEENGSRCNCCSIRQKRWGLFFFSVLYVPLFAGAFFGFGPMLIMLENNGSFSDECNNFNYTATADEDPVCPDQTAKLLTVPFVGQLMILTSPLVGAIGDHFGSLTLMSFLTLTGCSGVVFLLLAVLIPVDNLLFLFSICCGMMANAASILTVKTGMVFSDDNDPGRGDQNVAGETENNQRKDQNQSRVISILNALFDAGSITYLGLWGIFKLGVSLPTVIGIYLALAVFCLGGATVFWFALEDTATAKTRESLEQETLEASPDIQKQLKSETALGDSGRSAEISVDKTTNPDAGNCEDDSRDQALTPAASTTSTRVDDLATYSAQSPTYVLVSDRPPRDQLLSLPFIMLLLFFAVNLARNMFVLTTARDFIRYLSDDKENGELYLTIFTLLMPASLVGLPFSDQVIARFGFHTGFQIVCLLAIVHGIIQISCDELNGVQIFGFVVFSFYRCFLFSIVFSYLPTLLGPNVVGKGVGALHLAGGTMAFLNIPLSNVAVKHFDGNFFVPNLIYTILAIPCVGAAWFIGQTIQKEASVK